MFVSQEATASVSIRTEHFQIISEDAGRAEKFKNISEQIYEDISKDLGLDVEGKIQLRIYSSKREFKRLTGSGDIAGIAFPKEKRIDVLYNPQTFNTVLRHEINHIIFLSGLPEISNIPIWFSEGLAIYHSKPGIEAISLESAAFKVDRFYGDFYLSENEVSQEEIRDISALGYFRVRFLVQEFGEEMLFSLAREIHEGQELNEILKEKTGLSSSELDKDWDKYYKKEKKANQLNLLRNAGYILIGILAFMVIAVFWIKKKLALRRMENEELEERELF